MKLAALIIFLTVMISLVLIGVNHDTKESENKLKETTEISNSIKNPCKVVEIFSWGHGHNMNYNLNIIVVDQEGKRYLINSNIKNVVEGDYWNICIKNKILSFCELVEDSSKVKER